MEYGFKLTGTTSILFHADDVMQADDLAAWRKDPDNKTLSVPGDDRSPPWTWITYLHHDGEHLALPDECLMKALCNAAARIIFKKQTTFKSLSQSGMLIMSEYCKFTNRGKQVAMDDILDLRDMTFHDQFEAVKKLGFRLLVKRAKVGQAKHVRVRAEFDAWSIEGVVAVNEPAITPVVLGQMFDIAGRYVGLLDWRPSAKTSPGPHGMFTAEVTAAKVAKRAG